MPELVEALGAKPEDLYVIVSNAKRNQQQKKEKIAYERIRPL